MTISSTTRIAGPFVGTGSASVFPFTFKVFAASDLDVIRLNSSTGVETTLVLTTDYTVTLNGNQNTNPGGSVTLVAGALASGFTLTITSDIANLQPTDLTNQGGFYPEVITDSLDRATIQIQQMADDLTRSIKTPISDGLSLNMELPAAAQRANSFLAFDASGEPTTVTAGSSGAPATITRQVFSGTGSQTVFTLASDPGALGNSAQVYIGGVYQQRSTYTIAGTTLTFSAAPVAGTGNIEFVNFLTSNIGATSADLVTYTPAGSGAVARSAASKFGETASVKDFGAVGDGITDDTIAMQAAITYAFANNKALYVPRGTYSITSSLNATNTNAGLLMYGDVTSNYTATPATGSVIKYTGTGHALRIFGNASPAHVTISGLAFVGTASADHAIEIDAAWYVTVQNCVFATFNAASASAVVLTYSTGGFVGVTELQNCTFYANTVCVFFEKPDTNIVLIDRCNFIDHTYAAIRNGDGTIGVAATTVNITNCHFESASSQYDIWSFGGAQAWTIADCYFEQGSASINSERLLFDSTGLSPINLAVTITGNTFRKELGAAATQLIRIVNCRGVIARNNWSSYPVSGSVSNRYSITTTAAENYDIEPFQSVAAATPYPASINGSTVYAGQSEFNGTKQYGGVLKFPSAQVPSTDVNTLDDYKEGTWTPVVAFGGASVGITYDATNTTGRYVKIGSTVFVWGRIILTSKGSSTGNATISLPIISSSSLPTAAVTVAFCYQTSPVFNGGVVGTSSTSFNLIYSGGSLATNAEFTNSTDIVFSAIYAAQT